MMVMYFPQTDSISLHSGENGEGEGDWLLNDHRVTLSFTGEQNGPVNGVEVFDITGRYLPLAPERGYDAATDTLTLCKKSAGNLRVVENGEFVLYILPDNREDWEWPVALDIRNASKHLGEVNETIIRKLKQESESSAG